MLDDSLEEKHQHTERPKVNFDETSKQLIQETRQRLPAKPGQCARYDYEYERNGTCNLFMFTEPQAGWRYSAVTQRRTMQDIAHQMQWLVDERYPQAEVIRVILDNLNTHKPASLYEAIASIHHIQNDGALVFVSKPLSRHRDIFVILRPLILNKRRRLH